MFLNVHGATDSMEMNIIHGNFGNFAPVNRSQITFIWWFYADIPSDSQAYDLRVSYDKRLLENQFRGHNKLDPHASSALSFTLCAHSHWHSHPVYAVSICSRKRNKTF